MTPLHSNPAFIQLLSGSFQRLLKRPLTPAGLSPEAAAKWLYEEAPFGLLAHDTAADPVFVYGNRAVQKRFEYDWEELTALPSRLSAEAPNREERQTFLERVTQHGYVDDYRGIRVSKSGKRFWIEDAIVWQLIDEDGQIRGQAAMIPHTRDI
jgi:PAS domain S-box-containing protein